MSTDAGMEAHFDRLPEPIVAKLRLLIGRLRRIIWLRGGLAVAAVAIGSILTIMAIDALVTIFSSTARWALSLIGLAATVAAAWRFLYRPLSREFTMTSIARLVEMRHPELEERISSSVELLDAERKGELTGSQQLIAALVKEAVAESETVQPAREFSKRSVVPYLVASATAAVILSLLFLIWPTQTSRLFARALAPYAEIGNAYSWRLMVEPGNVRVAEGDRLAIHASIAGPRATRAELRRVNAGGVEVVERMALTPDEGDGVSRFTLDFPALTEGFRYRVRVGRALSEYYTADVIKRPALAKLSIRCGYPAYTGMATVMLTNGPVDVEAPVGTKLAFAAQFNKPLTAAQLVVNRKAISAENEAERGTVSRRAWPYTVRADSTGKWSLQLKDSYGFENTPAEYALTAIPDKPPIVQLSSPDTTELKMRPTDLLRISYVVRDDYGAGAASLMLGVDTGDLSEHAPSEVARLPDKRGMWAGSAALDLSTLKLAQVKSLRVAIRATDNLPPDLNGPQTGMSAVITIEIDQSAKSLVEQTLEAQAAEIRKALNSVKERLETAKTEAKDKPEKLAKDVQMPKEVKEQVEDIRHQTATAEKAMRDLADQVKETAFDKLAKKMEDVQKEDITPAREAAEEIPLTDKTEQRVAKAETMKKEIDESLKGVDNLLKDLEKTKEEVRELARLEELAREQERLAAQAEAQENKPDAAAMPDAWKDQEKALASNIGDMMTNQAPALAEQLKQNEQQARELAKEAAELAKEQEQMRDALANKDNQALKDALTKELARQQEEIAHDAAELQKETPKTGQENVAPMNEAKKDTAEAAQDLRGDKLEDAQKPAAEARDELQEAAKELNEQPKGTPEQKEAAREMAEEAKQLAERQDNVLKAMEALAKGDLQKAMTEMEKGLAEEAHELAQEMGEMKDEAADLNAPPEAAKEAGNAEQQMERGEGKAKEAAEHLPKSQEQAQAQAATQAETEAAQAMRQAAEMMNHMADQFAQAEKAMANELAAETEPPMMNPAEMTDAYKQAMHAAHAGKPHQASTAAHAAAENLQQMAQQASRQLGMPLSKAKSMAMSNKPPTPPGMVADPQGGRKGPVPEGEMPKIFEILGIARADWLRMKGELRSDAAGGADANAPAEYRDLVKKYFEEVARQGADTK